VRFATVQVVAGAEAVQVRPSGDDVTVYAVMADAPTYDGAPHDTLAWDTPALAVTPVGASGNGDVGLIAFDGADGNELPLAFSAVTLKT
jgi:hypothetical protein